MQTRLRHFREKLRIFGKIPRVEFSETIYIDESGKNLPLAEISVQTRL
ncbi:MAG: hypothetical protein QNJ68_18095 [Microcoleaceae cyanobacterium MO_207.B10]|nr:hypothetical protein [Microcoleaceae cyanobacterium MO_207.B10]